MCIIETMDPGQCSAFYTQIFITNFIQFVKCFNPISADRVVYDPRNWVNWVIFSTIGKVYFLAFWRCL